jgi:hypothetical protein
VFPKRGYVLPKFGRLSFYVIVYALIPVKSVGFNCSFDKLPEMRKFIIMILVFAFLVSSIKVILFQNVIH